MSSEMGTFIRDNRRMSTYSTYRLIYCIRRCNLTCVRRVLGIGTQQWAKSPNTHPQGTRFLPRYIHVDIGAVTRMQIYTQAHTCTQRQAPLLLCLSDNEFQLQVGARVIGTYTKGLLYPLMCHRTGHKREWRRVCFHEINFCLHTTDPLHISTVAILE